MREATTKGWLGQLEGTFVPLLVALIAMFVIPAFVEEWDILLTLLLSLLLITGVFTIQRNPTLRYTVVVVLVAGLMVRWLSYFYAEQSTALVLTSHVLIAAYMLLLGGIAVETVLRRKKINHDTILGAICGYLLLAFVFAYIYEIIVTVLPGAFSGLEPASASNVPGSSGMDTHSLLYFSFVTITTTGYGDITPVHPIARTLAVLEALAGQLYLAGFVARLVGILGKDTDSTTS